MKRTVVAQFHRHAGKIWLWSLIVFDEEVTPRGAYMVRKEYNVDYSKTFGYLFDQCGQGGGTSVRIDGLYHVSKGDVDITVRERPSNFVTRKMRRLNPTRRLQSIPRHFDVGPGHDLLNWLECNGINQDSVWCSECRNSVPGDELCEHCWWCDKTGWYSTPSDRCECKTREECYGD